VNKAAINVDIYLLIWFETIKIEIISRMDMSFFIQIKSQSKKSEEMAHRKIIRVLEGWHICVGPIIETS